MKNILQIIILSIILSSIKCENKNATLRKLEYDSLHFFDSFKNKTGVSL